MTSELVRILTDGGHTLVVSGTSLRTFDGRGVRDLYRLLTTEPEVLDGAAVADKVVGKAAAALMILGGVRELYACVLSEQAQTLLSASSIRVDYGRTVPHIINRDNTGWCPLERLCRDCDTARECKKQIDEFFNQ